MEQRISIERMEQAVNIFGSFDENVRLLEKEFSVAVTNRDGELRINGEPENVMHAAKAVQAMLTLSSRGEALGEQNVRYVIDMVRAGREEQISELAGDVLCISAKGRPVKPKTLGQKEYIQSVLKNTITIGVGPAGTREQMKMFLTRLGFGSKIVITGDVTQIDLPDGKPSGLREAMRVLRNVEGIGICELTNADVVRHVMVQRIVKAYEEYETAKNGGKGKK